MSRDPLASEPQRWLDRASDDPGHVLLRQANREYELGLTPTRSWYALQQRRKRRAGTQALTLALALVGATLVSLWFAHPRQLIDPTPALVLMPEPPRPARSASSSAHAPPPASVAESVLVTPKSPSPAPRRSARGTGTPPARASAQAEPSQRVHAKAVGAQLAQSTTSPPTDGDVLEPARSRADETRCRQLAVGAPAESALCFEQLARGERLQAEVALLEIARIRAERLGDSRGALLALQEHRRRFPNGALRGEVDVATVRALARLGHTAEALTESAELLAKPWGRAVASELHLLRGRLYEERLGNCSRAVTEYVALLGERGAAAEEAELRRARCLVTLGRRADARQALERYLERKDALFRGQARETLAGLGAPESLEPARTAPASSADALPSGTSPTRQ